MAGRFATRIGRFAPEAIRTKKPYFHNVRTILANHLEPAIRKSLVLRSAIRKQKKGSVREPRNDSRESGDARKSGNRFARIGPSKVWDFQVFCQTFWELQFSLENEGREWGAKKKKTHKEKKTQTKFSRDCPGIFGGILLMCFFSPIRKDPKKHTHTQTKFCHPPNPGTIPQLCLCLHVFFSLKEGKTLWSQTWPGSRRRSSSRHPRAADQELF